MPQQGLGRHDDQRLAEGPVHLATQDVEIVGRGGAVGDLHIVLGALLQEALQPGGGMLRTLTFIAMGQQHGQAAHAQPFAFARGDELVDHHLGAVHEVPELGLPHHQGVGVGQGIAVFKAQHRLFRQGGIDHLERGLAGAQVVEGDVAGLGRLVDDAGMALAEGAAHRVLARQAHGKALVEQGGEGQAFGGGPVQTLSGLDRLAPPLEHALQRLVDVDGGRDLGQGAAEVAQPVHGHGGLAAALVALGQADALPLAVHPVGLLRLEGLAGLELGVEEGLEAGDLGVDAGLVDDAFLDQTPGVDLARRRLGLDLGVHQRLGEGRIVALIVAEAAVAEHVHHHVLGEFLTELRGHLGGEDHGFGIVPVDVQDRGLDHQGDVGRIGRGPAVARGGGEADLVVDHEMDRAAGAVALQPHQGEAFGHHALAGEGGVAVDQQRQDLGPVQRPLRLGDAGMGLTDVEGLFGARLAQHHRIDDLEVGGVGGQRQVDPVGVEDPVRAGAHVIFDVARALDVAGHGRAALELVEDGAIGLAHHRRQDVQATAVGHAQNDLVDAQGAAALDDLLQRRDHGLATVEAEAFGAGEAPVQEALEGLGLDQLVQDGQLALAGEAGDRQRFDAFDPLLQPGLLLRLGDVHELHAQRPAIGAGQDFHDLTDGAGLQTQDAAEEDRTIQIAGAEAVEFGGQFGVLGRRFQPQRIQLGPEVAAHAIAADQHQGADGILGGGADDIGRGGGDRRGRGGRSGRGG